MNALTPELKCALAVYRETVQLQREEIAERTRERDEALRLVASLTATAHMQAGIMQAELKLLTETYNRDLSDALAVLLKRFNEGESK